MRRIMASSILLGLIVALLTIQPAHQADKHTATIVSSPVHPYIIPAATPLTGTATFQNNGFTPQQIRGAYGVSSTFQGKGITIAIIDAYYHPTAAHDFDVFSRQFGLPTIAGGCGCFQQVDVNGNDPSGLAQDSGWGSETDLDIEWAHAMAPQAKILLIESSDNTTLYGGFAYAAAHAQVISNSWGAAEPGGVSQTALDAVLQSAGASAAVLASAGDTLSPAGFPALSPYVLAVGGTALTVSGTCGTTNWAAKGCTYGSETTWHDSPTVGTGGSLSTVESTPAFQASFCGATANQNACGGNRGAPDIALVAAATTPVAIYDSTADMSVAGHPVNWYGVGGTSLSSPALAGMIADADAARQITLTTGSLTSRFSYKAATANAASYHDITTGNNDPGSGCCYAGTGWDLTTGVGTPNFLTWVMNVNN
jgi:subtilase family serine protease